MADPPVFVGAVHVSDTCVLPDVPATAVGAAGTAIGETPLDTVE
jgi:hypothetical protein